MKSAFFEFVFNAMMRMIAGKRYYGDDVGNSAEAKMFQEIVAETSRLAAEKNLGDFLPFVQWFGSSGIEKRFVQLHHKRDKFMQDLIYQQRDQVGSDESCFGEKKRTMIEILLSLHDAEPEYYTDEIIKSLMLVRDLFITNSLCSMHRYLSVFCFWDMIVLLSYPSKVNDMLDHRWMVIKWAS